MFYHVLPCFERLYITRELFWVAVYHTRPILSGCIPHETYFEQLYITRDLFWVAVYHTRAILSGWISHGNGSHFCTMCLKWPSWGFARPFLVLKCNVVFRTPAPSNIVSYPWPVSWSQERTYLTQMWIWQPFFALGTSLAGLLVTGRAYLTKIRKNLGFARPFWMFKYNLPYCF